MAEPWRSARIAASTVASTVTSTLSAPDTTPPVPGPTSPPTVLHTTLCRWPARRTIHRFHRDVYGSTQCNDTGRGNARFSPIRNAAGEIIPTLYGGATFDCAAMETVFHDVPFAPGFKSFDKRKLQGIVYSQIMTQADLQLVDLRSKALRKLGVARTDLIDTEKDRYAHTRQWAEAIHAQCEDAQGLCWTSRQDDSAEAVMLFGDRIATSSLPQFRQRGQLAQFDTEFDIVAPATPVLDDEAVYDLLLSLADRIGVNVVRG